MKQFFSGRHFYDGVKESSPHPAATALALALFLAAAAVVSAAPRTVLQLFSDKFFDNDAATAEQLTLALSLILTSAVGALVIVHCKYFERRSLESAGLKKKGCFKLYLIGAAVGAAEISAVIGLCYAVGVVKYNGVFILNGSDGVMFALICVGWIIQGTSEELVFRGWLMSSLTGFVPAWAAVLANSAVFSLAHILNAGFGIADFISAMLWGIWLSLLSIRFDSIIPCFAAHTLRNLGQSCIFGLDENIPSVWKFSFAGGRGLWTGGELAEIIILTALIALTCLIPKPRTENSNCN